MEKNQSIVGASLTLGNKYLAPLLKEMLDRTDDELFAMSSKAASSTDQTLYFTTMRELRRLRADVERDFHAHIKQAALGLLKGKRVHAQDKPAVDLESLSLMEEDSLEESLAFKGMVDKLQNRNEAALGNLERRFDHLLQGHGEKADDYPLSPKTICEAFDKAIRPLEADLQVRLSIYKYFDRYVISNLGALYEALNQLLINEGILPKLSYNLKKSQEQSRPAPVQQRTEAQASGPPARDARNTATPGDNDTPEALLNQALNELFSAPSGGQLMPLNPDYAQDPTRVVQPVALGQLVSALTNMQSQLEAGTSLSEFKSRLAGALDQGGESGNAPGLHQRESSLIDFVAILFEYIFEDTTIPSTAKSLLGRLQIPFVKIALLDQALLSNQSHPARQLLNRLAESCMGYEPDIPIKDSPLLIEIERVVERVIEGFKDDLSLFDTLLAEFNQFLERLEQEGNKVNGTLLRSREVQEESRRLHLQVDEIIREQLGAIPLPKAMVALLTEQWREVLLYTARTRGMESLLWDEQVRFIRVMARSVVPKESVEERKHLAKQIPHLIRLLREGLQSIQFDSQQTMAIMTSLEAMHMSILQPALHRAKKASKRIPPKVVPETEAVPTPLAVEASVADEATAVADDTLRGADEALDMLFNLQSSYDESLDAAMSYDEWAENDEVMQLGAYEDPDSPDKDLPPVDEEFIEQARQLELGSWYLLEKDDGNKVRCKLVWKSEFLGDYVFADWRHKVVAEHTLKSIAYVISQDKLSALEHTPLLDRAIGYAISRFRKLKEGMGSAEGDKLEAGVGLMTLYR